MNSKDIIMALKRRLVNIGGQGRSWEIYSSK